MSKVTIYIPSYNYENYIKECLDSVVSQKYDPMEILIYDDYSTDKSWDILNEYADKDSRIVLKRGENHIGPNGGINWALDKASKWEALLKIRFLLRVLVDHELDRLEV